MLLGSTPPLLGLITCPGGCGVVGSGPLAAGGMGAGDAAEAPAAGAAGVAAEGATVVAGAGVGLALVKSLLRPSLASSFHSP